MKTVRLFALTIIMLTLAMTVSAETGSATTKGWGLGLGAFDGDFGLQARKDFWLGGDISQITAQGGVNFTDPVSFRLDADYHFIINPESPSRFYPLLGLDFAFTSDHAKFGLNAGGGANFMLTDSMAAFAELKYVFSDWDGFGFMVGIYL